MKSEADVAPETRIDIEARSICKRFGDHEVLRDVNLRVRDGETYVIIGASGCGKSVFLKHILGLLKPDSGRVFVFGRDIGELSDDELLQVRRRVGMVFQLSALFSWLTVAENIALGLVEEGGHSPSEIDDIVTENLRLVDMDGTQKLLPEVLSGGMKKRVAVARALAMKPEIILFDEPTVGLDPIMSDNVDELIEDLKEKVKITSVVVTHDMVSAFRVGDRIGMMHDKHIIAEGTPDEIRHTAHATVRKFIARSL